MFCVWPHLSKIKSQNQNLIASIYLDTTPTLITHIHIVYARAHDCYRYRSLSNPMEYDNSDLGDLGDVIYSTVLTGNVIFIYKGIHYVFNDYGDSGPDGLGENIVSEVDSWSDVDVEDMKKYIEAIPPSKNYPDRVDELDMLDVIVSYPHDYEYTIHENVCGSDMKTAQFVRGVQYIYTLDFDKNELVVDWCETSSDNVRIHKQVTRPMLNAKAEAEAV